MVNGFVIYLDTTPFVGVILNLAFASSYSSLVLNTNTPICLAASFFFKINKSSFWISIGSKFATISVLGIYLPPIGIKFFIVLNNIVLSHIAL